MPVHVRCSRTSFPDEPQKFEDANDQKEDSKRNSSHDGDIPPKKADEPEPTEASLSAQTPDGMTNVEEHLRDPKAPELNHRESHPENR